MRLVCMQEGDWHTRDDVAAADLDAEGGRLCWIRAGGVSTPDLREVGRRLGLHPLALEDVENPRQRPKVEDYAARTFVVLRIPRPLEQDVEWQQVGIFVGPNFVLTASTKLVPELDEVEARLLREGLPGDRQTAGDLLHRIIDRIVDSWFPYVDDLEEGLEELEERAVQDADQATLGEIRLSKQLVSKIRKVSHPMRDALINLERSSHPNVGEHTRIYLRDVSDHMVRLTERLEHVREVAMFAQESWNATLANQQNQVMKRLTVVAALLLVPSLLAGLGGMNFPNFPEWDYWRVTGGILAFVGVGVAFAVWRRWL